jgi:hypothetical protein
MLAPIGVRELRVNPTPRPERPARRRAVVLGVVLATLIILLALVYALARPDDGGLRGISGEEVSEREMAAEAERALEAGRRARRLLAGREPEVAEALDEAIRSLELLDSFHLPVIEARDLASNALLFHRRGQRQRAEREVERAEEILLAASRSPRAWIGRELAQPLEAAAAARVAVAEGSPDAERHLRELVHRLNVLEVRAAIAVPRQR